MNLFSDIEKDEIERMLVCSRAVKKKLSAGEYIFQQGETPQMIFLLQSGEAALVKDFASGKRNLLYTVKPNDVFGEAFLFSDQSHTDIGLLRKRPGILMSTNCPGLVISLVSPSNVILKMSAVRASLVSILNSTSFICIS